MKKITFVLFALIAGTTFAQTVSSTAEIIEAITFTETTGLNFGKVDNTAGTVIIPTDGSAATGKTQLGGTTSAAVLAISGGVDEAYNITFDPTATLTDLVSSNTLSVTGLGYETINSGTTTTILDSSGNDTVTFGGVLNVTGGEAAGTYSGDFTVTVSYN